MTNAFFCLTFIFGFIKALSFFFATSTIIIYFTNIIYIKFLTISRTWKFNTLYSIFSSYTSTVFIWIVSTCFIDFYTIFLIIIKFTFFFYINILIFFFALIIIFIKNTIFIYFYPFTLITFSKTGTNFITWNIFILNAFFLWIVFYYFTMIINFNCFASLIKFLTF